MDGMLISVFSYQLNGRCDQGFNAPKSIHSLSAGIEDVVVMLQPKGIGILLDGHTDRAGCQGLECVVAAPHDIDVI